VAERLRRALGLGSLTLERVLRDPRLPGLGDAVLNYIASASESIRAREPRGARVSNRALLEAVRASGLRGLLAKRMGRQDLGDAAEALVAYALVEGLLKPSECVDILVEEASIEEGLKRIIQLAMKRVGGAHAPGQD